MVKSQHRMFYNVIISSVASSVLETATVISYRAVEFMFRKFRTNIAVNSASSMALVFLINAMLNWILAPIMGAIGPRTTIFVGYALATFYFLHFLADINWLYYLACVTLGIAKAFWWSGQENYLILNTLTEDIPRSATIFWAFVNSGRFMGSLILFCLDMETIKTSDVELILIVFGGVICALALLIFLFGHVEYNRSKKGFCQHYLDTMKVYTHKNMMLLFLVFVYTGLEACYWNVAYQIALYNMEIYTELDHYKRQNLSAMIINVGAIVGCAIFGILGKKFRNWGYFPIVVAGVCLELICFVSTILIIPNDAVFEITNKHGLISCSLTVTCLFGVLFGIGHLAITIQCFSILSKIFVDHSDIAICVWNGFLCTGHVIGYFCIEAGTYAYVSVLIIGSILATVCFILFEKTVTYQPDDNKIPTNGIGERINRNLMDKTKEEKNVS